jgi:hypothetical protein
VCVTCVEFSIRIHVCEVYYVWRGYSFVCVMLLPALFFVACLVSECWVGLVPLFIMCFGRYLLLKSCITLNIGLWVSMYVVRLNSSLLVFTSRVR